MLLLVVLLSVSCGDDTKSAPVVKPQPQPETPKSYTILYYGSGGGLDDFMEWMIRDVAQVKDIPKSINIVGQVKWDEYHYSENSNGKGGVSRFKYNHKNRVVNYSKYAGPGKRIDDAENLAEFIQWARETAPADEYILVKDGTTYINTNVKTVIANIINTDGYVIAFIICFLFVSCCL